MGKKIYLDLTYDVSVNKLGEEKDHLCNKDMDYNYDANFYSTVAHENEKRFNCSVPFHPPTKSNVTGKLIEICKNSSLGIKAYNNRWKVYSKMPQIHNYKPCTWIDVTLGMPHVSQKEGSFIRLYFKSHFKIKSIISYYDFSSLIADVGGYTGMLLGISLIDLTVQFNNLLVRVIVAKFKHTCQFKE